MNPPWPDPATTWLAPLGVSLVLGLACVRESPPAEPDEEAPVEHEADAEAPSEREVSAVAPDPDPDAAPDSEPGPEPDTKPDPEPEPEPEPLDEAAIAALLEEADAIVDELGIALEPRAAAKGPMPAESGLREAYREHRAIGLSGRLEQVRNWMALAKFADVEPGPNPAVGPLAGYDLVVTRDRDADKAYLHIVVPPLGLADTVGTHEAWIAGERWTNLGDHLEPGREYLPFKTDGQESLHRQWAEVAVVDSLATIAREYAQATGGQLGIGDLSHVTGGKIEDHWTHKKGVDADLYLLDTTNPDPDGRPRVWWSHIRRGASLWTSKPKGKGKHEPGLDPDDPDSETASGAHLRALATIVLNIDAIAYFVHNDTNVLATFDQRAGDRRPGRRFLHADNRGYWPAHTDHVHLRWVDGKLPVDVTPRP